MSKIPEISEEEVVRLRDPVTFKCPFCNQTVTIGKLPDERTAITHTLPICEKFSELEPTEFVHQAYLAVAWSIN
jgi:transcription elongation factor Elf1